MFLFFVLLLVGGYYLLHHSENFACHRVKSENAEEILKQRYVAGEIDEETYDRMMKTIRS